MGDMLIEERGGGRGEREREMRERERERGIKKERVGGRDERCKKRG